MVVDSNQGSEDSFDRYYLEEADHEPTRDGKLQKADSQPTSDTKLVVELKGPKSSERFEEVEEGEITSSVVKNEHYCSECGRSFSSGKALGGHMSSAHVQAGRDYQSKRLRLKNSLKFKPGRSIHRADVFRGDGVKKIACGICGKDFPTRKSLYGHMRCHPDRDYRGMQPPESNRTRPSNHIYETPIEDFKEDSSMVDVKEDSPMEEVRENDSPTEEVRENDSPTEEDTNDIPFLGSISFDHFSSPCENEEDQSPDRIDTSTTPIDLTRFLSSWTVTGPRGRPEVSSFSEVERLSVAADSLVSLGNMNSACRHPEEDMTLKSMMVEGRKKKKTKFYPSRKGKGFQAKSVKMGERKPNSDAVDYYEDLRRSSKSKRIPDKRQFSPAKKVIIGEGKPKRQIFQRAAVYEGKGKAPMPVEPKFGDGIYESGDEDEEDFSTRYESNDGDSDSEKTPEPQNQEFLELGGRNNGFVPYKKRFEKNIQGKERKQLSNTEPDLIPVAEKKDAIASEVTPERYKCSTCSKTFSTHQALGGHRSSHNKLRVSVQNAVDGSSPENQSNCNTSQILEAKDQVYNSGNPHQCQICTKVFASGQALGGHMRCHASAAPVISQVESLEEDSILSAKKVLNFDLNQLPDDMEDATGSY